MSFTLYLGCVIETMYPNIAKAVRETLRNIGVEAEEAPGASCCAPLELFSLSRGAWLRLNERNMGLFKNTVIVACDNCFASLSDSFRILSERHGARPPEVKPFEVVLLERLKQNGLRFSFNGLRCAVQHSCHLLRPSSRGFDDPEGPRIVKEALETLGYLPIGYEGEKDCCGGLVFNDTARIGLAAKKAVALENTGADCIVVTCSHCLLQLQSAVRIPVLHLSQLSALSMGLSPLEIGIPESLVRRMIRR
ncbi:MAG: heterodisulfide reductase-related iron-sulfur binding cluster [Thermoproteota archaeon]